MAIPSVNPFSQVPGGGVNTAMRGINETVKSNLENAYYGPIHEAEIAAKNTYARYLPAQTLATIISQPNFWTQPKEVVDSIVGQYRNAIANPPTVQSLSGGNPVGGGLLNMFLQKIGLTNNPFANNQNQPNNNPMNSPSNVSNAPSSGPSGRPAAIETLPGPEQPTQKDERLAAYIAEGNDRNTPIPPDWQPKSATQGTPPAVNIPAAPGGTAKGVPATSVERIAANQGAGDTSYGGINPQSIATAQAAGLSARASGEAGAQVEQQKVMESRDIDAAKAANDTNQLLIKASDLHAQIPQWQRGKLGGNLPALNDKADELDATIEGIVANMTIQQSNGNVTNDGRALARASKTSRSMTDDAFKHLIEYNRGMNDRVLEKPAFNQIFAEKGYTPAQTETLWLYYQSTKPFYDNKTHTKDSVNIGSWDKLYSDPRNIQAAFSPSAAKIIKETMAVPSGEESRKANMMALPGGLKVPKSFNSQQDFNDWYLKQPKTTQLAYQQYLKSNASKSTKKGKK